MSQQTTIRKLAELVNTPVEKLLEQLAEAGMSFSGPDQVVTSMEKVKLLGFLKRSHGKSDAATDEAAPKKITLNRRKVQEVTVAAGRTKTTVAVEVRQKRTYVKPTDAESVATNWQSEADPERAEILRKLEESRQRNLDEQRRLAQEDAKRAEELERRRQEEAEARAAAEAARAQAEA
ncbi:MAG: translation initiation factor IF-2 associated domain-containing protein, partial [Arenimonas sp.]|nr:translation initiation factor IF-2 associated domain-containing protein [Arenimonas sp.]